MTTTLKWTAAMLTLASLGSGAALACDVGNIQCDSAGYRYVCQCYTSSGCQYYPDGSCTAYHASPPEIVTRRIGYVERTDGFTSRMIRLGLDRARPPSP